MRNKISALLVVFCLCLFFTRPISAHAYALSKGEVVMEVMSGRVLHEKNPNEKLPMASTTKIVTAITVIENCDINDEIIVPESCTGVEGSSVYLKAGERYKIIDLLYGLMLRSGNDAAETLAVVVGGSMEGFVKMMNETAKKAGAFNSAFKNPHGLPDKGHYTTASDLAKISCYAMKNDIFRKIVSEKTYTATELTCGEKRMWKNKNKMLFNFEGANGIKTGYTVKAGRCLVSSAIRNGMELVAVVLDSPQMFERSSELLENAYSEFNLVKIIDPERFDNIIFDKTKKNVYELSKPEKFIYPVGKNEKIVCDVNFDSFAEESVGINEKVGEIKIYCSKQLIFSQNIYTLSMHTN